MRHGPQTPTYDGKKLWWGIGDDPDITFAVKASTFRMCFPIEKARPSRDEFEAVAGKHWETLQRIALEAHDTNKTTERHLKHLSHGEQWFEIDATAFRDIAAELGYDWRD